MKALILIFFIFRRDGPSKLKYKKKKLYFALRSFWIYAIIGMGTSSVLPIMFAKTNWIMKLHFLGSFSEQYLCLLLIFIIDS